MSASPSLNGATVGVDRARRLKLDKFFDRHGWNFDETLQTLGSWVFCTGAGRREEVIRWARNVLEDLEETAEAGEPPRGPLKEGPPRERRLRRRSGT